MKTNLILTVLLISASVAAFGQNFTSLHDGDWTVAGNWNNTSGWGSSTPSITGGHASGTATVNNNLTINASYILGSASVNINANKTLTIGGNLTLNGGSSIAVSGNLIIYGDVTLNSTLVVLPGGSVTVYGSVTVVSSNYLVVGNAAGGPPYADLIIRNDLKQVNSGDVTLNKNSRVAVFGNVVDDTDGGTKLTLNQGAEMYVNGNINYSGGGDNIANNNSTNPYGLYVNGTVSNTGGGATTTGNKTDKATMTTTNPTFATWVNTAAAVMPVTLTSFEVTDVSKEGIELEWVTASEKNFDYFVVEGSNDGHEFYELTKTRSYSYLVANPPVGRSYYRLKTVDLDGSTEIFKIVSATFQSDKSIKIFPNPVVDSKLNIELNFDGAAIVTITNLSGMEVLRRDINQMQNVIPVSLEAGTYLVKVSSSDVNSVFRIVVR